MPQGRKERAKIDAKEEMINAAFAVAKAASCIYQSQGITDETIKLCERLDLIALELFAYVRRLK